MLKMLASRFGDFNPVLVNAQLNSVFDANLNALAAHKDVEALMSGENASSDNFWLPEESYLSKYRPYSVKNGILTIQVRGVLLHDFPWALAWATGYAYIWEAFKRGQNDPDVTKIAIVYHSPGGEVAGCFECADRMYAMKGSKPVHAFAHEYAYSAAYALASTADKITVSKTGGVGSIGVVTSHTSYAKMFEDIGMETTFITFGKHKVDGNQYEALSKDAKDRIQSRINDLGEIFVAGMARNRGLSEKVIRDTEALTYSAAEAISIGLADYVGPLDEALAAFAAADLSTEEGDEQMSNAATATQADLENARNEGFAAGKAEGLTEGAAAAKSRINGILASDNAKDRPTAALSAAMDTDMSVDQANTFLGKIAAETPVVKVEEQPTASKEEQKEGGNAQNFDAAMSKDKPDVGGNADKKDDNADADSAESVLDIAAGLGIPGLKPRKKA